MFYLINYDACTQMHRLINLMKQMYFSALLATLQIVNPLLRLAVNHLKKKERKEKKKKDCNM